jgi:sigma54-dependent transcription regulator
MNGFSLGLFSIPIAILSCLCLVITSIFMFFPSEYPVTKDNMNYTIVVVSGVALIATIYWFVSAGHRFVGAKRIDIDPTLLPSERIKPSNSRTILMTELSDMPYIIRL